MKNKEFPKNLLDPETVALIEKISEIKAIWSLADEAYERAEKIGVNRSEIERMASEFYYYLPDINVLYDDLNQKLNKIISKEKKNKE